MNVPWELMDVLIMLQARTQGGFGGFGRTPLFGDIIPLESCAELQVA